MVPVGSSVMLELVLAVHSYHVLIILIVYTTHTKNDSDVLCSLRMFTLQIFSVAKILVEPFLTFIETVHNNLLDYFRNYLTSPKAHVQSPKNDVTTSDQFKQCQ